MNQAYYSANMRVSMNMEVLVIDYIINGVDIVIGMDIINELGGVTVAMARCIMPQVPKHCNIAKLKARISEQSFMERSGQWCGVGWERAVLKTR